MRSAHRADPSASIDALRRSGSIVDPSQRLVDGAARGIRSPATTGRTTAGFVCTRTRHIIARPRERVLGAQNDKERCRIRGFALDGGRSRNGNRRSRRLRRADAIARGMVRSSARPGGGERTARTHRNDHARRRSQLADRPRLVRSRASACSISHACWPDPSRAASSLVSAPTFCASTHPTGTNPASCRKSRSANAARGSI